jgi:hypothetical protein
MFPFFSRETTVQRRNDYDMLPADADARKKLRGA